jgi:hypothetical protein
MIVRSASAMTDARPIDCTASRFLSVRVMRSFRWWYPPHREQLSRSQQQLPMRIADGSAVSVKRTFASSGNSVAMTCVHRD